MIEAIQSWWSDSPATFVFANLQLLVFALVTYWAYRNPRSYLRIWVWLCLATGSIAAFLLAYGWSYYATLSDFLLMAGDQEQVVTKALEISDLYSPGRFFLTATAVSSTVFLAFLRIACVAKVAMEPRKTVTKKEESETDEQN